MRKVKRSGHAESDEKDRTACSAPAGRYGGSYGSGVQQSVWSVRRNSVSGNIKGIFYGVSTGPGDPELMTVKAVRILKEADVIAAARVMGKQETALEIAKQAVCREKSSRTVFWKTRLMDISQL